MRSTLEIPDATVEEARRLSRITRISDLVREGLKALIERESRKRLSALGGSDPQATAPERRRKASIP